MSFRGSVERLQDEVIYQRIGTLRIGNREFSFGCDLPVNRGGIPNPGDVIRILGFDPEQIRLGAIDEYPQGSVVHTLREPVGHSEKIQKFLGKFPTQVIETQIVLNSVPQNIQYRLRLFGNWSLNLTDMISPNVLRDLGLTEMVLNAQTVRLSGRPFGRVEVSSRFIQAMQQAR